MLFVGKCEFCGTAFHLEKPPQDNKCPSCGALIHFDVLKPDALSDIAEVAKADTQSAKPVSLQDKMKDYNKKLKVLTAREVVIEVITTAKLDISTAMKVSALICFGALVIGSVFVCELRSEELWEFMAFIPFVVLIASLLVSAMVAAITGVMFSMRASHKIQKSAMELYERYESDYQRKRKIVLGCLNSGEKQTVLDEKMIASEMTFDEFQSLLCTMLKDEDLQTGTDS